MASSTGFSIRPVRNAPVTRFAGGAAGTAAATAAQTGTQTAATSVQQLGFFGTIKTLAQQMKNEQTRNVASGLALKYLPDLTMSSLFAIPVLGWAAGIIAIPFSMFLTGKGEKIIEKAKVNLDKKGNSVHYGLHHSLKVEEAMAETSDVRYFGKAKKHELAVYIVKKYNKGLQGIFSTSEALQKKLKINHEGNSWAFRIIKRLTDARQSLRQTPFIGKIFNWMSGISDNKLQRALPKPKPVQLLLLLPRMGLLGIYFILGRKPKFKLPIP